MLTIEDHDRALGGKPTQSSTDFSAEQHAEFQRLIENDRRTIHQAALSNHQPTRSNVGHWTYGGVYMALAQIQGSHDETALWSFFKVTDMDSLLATTRGEPLTAWFFARGWQGPWTYPQMMKVLGETGLNHAALAAHLGVSGLHALEFGILQEYWPKITEFFLQNGWNDPMLGVLSRHPH